MRKIIGLSVIFLLLAGNTKAGNNENFLNMSVGYMFPRSYVATLAFEHEFIYQQGFEVFADYYNGYTSSKFNAIRQITGGIAYKLPIIRFKNSMVRFRGGLECGSDMNKFIYGPELGLEYAVCVGSKLQITLQQKNEFHFGALRKFHSGFLIGLRIPL